jgi:hypothetical protein
MDRIPFAGVTIVIRTLSVYALNDAAGLEPDFRSEFLEISAASLSELVVPRVAFRLQ